MIRSTRHRTTPSPPPSSSPKTGTRSISTAPRTVLRTAVRHVGCPYQFDRRTRRHVGAETVRRPGRGGDRDGHASRRHQRPGAVLSSPPAAATVNEYPAGLAVRPRVAIDAGRCPHPVGVRLPVAHRRDERLPRRADLDLLLPVDAVRRQAALEWLLASRGKFRVVASHPKRGGWRIPNWTEHNSTVATVDKNREKWRENKKRQRAQAKAAAETSKCPPVDRASVHRWVYPGGVKTKTKALQLGRATTTEL